MIQSCRAEENVTTHPVLHLCLSLSGEGKHGGKKSSCTKAIFSCCIIVNEALIVMMYYNTRIYPVLMFSYF